MDELKKILNSKGVRTPSVKQLADLIVARSDRKRPLKPGLNP